jgi:hypothetical protein
LPLAGHGATLSHFLVIMRCAGLPDLLCKGYFLKFNLGGVIVGELQLRFIQDILTKMLMVFDAHSSYNPLIPAVFAALDVQVLGKQHNSVTNGSHKP